MQRLAKLTLAFITTTHTHYIQSYFMNRLLVSCAIALILFMPSLYAQERQGPPAALVVVVKAVQKKIAPTALYSATVISRDDAYLVGEIKGRLTWAADVGDNFSKGDLVAKLDDVFIKQQTIEEQATIQSETAKFNFYSKEVERFKKLLLDNNVARNQLDRAISDKIVARSNIASATARLTQAQERLKRTSIIAPFAGVVSERLLQSGEWAKDGEAIVRLVSTNNLEIQTHIPASSLQFVTLGTPLTYMHDKAVGSGRVRALVPVGGDVSRLYELRIAVSDTLLSAGNLLRVAVPSAHAREAILVPRDALVLRREGIFVYRINQQSISEKVTVETGIAEIGNIEVIGNIQPGDQVVIRGGENLRPGFPVIIKP